MKPILTGEIVSFLKSKTAIASLVGERIYTKQISAYRDLPAIAINKLSQTSAEDHAGPIGIYSTMIRIFVFARTLADVEAIKQEINLILDGEMIGLDGIDGNFSLTNDADYDEYELLEAEEFAGVLEYECNWSYSE